MWPVPSGFLALQSRMPLGRLAKLTYKHVNVSMHLGLRFHPGCVSASCSAFLGQALDMCQKGNTGS